MWCPVTCEKPDGSRYAIHWYTSRTAKGSWQRVDVQGGIEHANGHKDHFVGLSHDLEFDPENRRFRRGELRFVMADGSERPLRVEAVSDTGFHLGAGLYFGLDDHWHGQWRGKLLVESEYTADCADRATAERLHQLRDCIVRVEDPAGGGVGWGNLEALAFGPHPDLGLSAESSFR
jgi:GNAT superfamily N-acetyltransferase